MKGIGCDLCSIERMERCLKNPRFVQRVFTLAEQAEIARRGAATAAGLWAAKEACAKALGSGFVGFGPAQIEVLKDELGAPALRLSGGAQQRMSALRATSARLSISHESGLALAFCVLE